MPLQRKAVPLDAWHLTDQAAMLSALGDLSADGWRGGITQTGGTWHIELNADNPTRQIIAGAGDWLVDDMGLRKLSAAECADNYDEVS